jgi:hypothetical protein
MAKKKPQLPEGAAPDAGKPVVVAEAPPKAVIPEEAPVMRPLVQRGLPAADRITTSEGAALELPTTVNEQGELIINNTALLKQYYGADLTDAEFYHFAQICLWWNLDPVKHQIYAIAGNSKSSGNRYFYVVVDYRQFPRRAARSGQLLRWQYEERFTDQQKTQFDGVEVTIWRKDWGDEHPFKHFVPVDEVEPRDYPSPKWKSSRRFMTLKTAIKQAFDLCFADTGLFEGSIMTDADVDSALAVERTQQPAVESDKARPKLGIASDRKRSQQPALPAGTAEVKQDPAAAGTADAEKPPVEPAPPKPKEIETLDLGL